MDDKLPVGSVVEWDGGKTINGDIITAIHDVDRSRFIFTATAVYVDTPERFPLTMADIRTAR